MSNFRDLIKDAVQHFSTNFSTIIKNQKKIMDELQQLKDGQAKLNTAVADLQASVDLKQAAIADAISALKAQIAAGIPASALQPIIDGLSVTQAAVEAAKADVDSTPTA